VEATRQIVKEHPDARVIIVSTYMGEEHARHVIFQMAEVAVPRDLFSEILRLIALLRRPPAPAQMKEVARITPAQEKSALNSEYEAINHRTRPCSTVPTANGGPHRVPDYRKEPHPGHVR
jgi:DNA-binding NarL/FixJ family response regulator